VPGMQIPSENEIIARHRVSNTTARKVHQELERTGWVTRVKGKGTYVRDKRVDRSANRILGFTRNMIEEGYRPSTRVLDVNLRPGGRRIMLQGRRFVLPGPVCAIRRLRLADGQPMMLETRYVSTRLCPGIETQDLAGSLYDVYRDKYGLELAHIDQSLSAVVLDAAASGFSGIEGMIPAFRVNGVTFCAKEVVLEIEESVYRGDRYRFLVRATRWQGGQDD
jgi:GntR family transcriptional regulator